MLDQPSFVFHNSLGSSAVLWAWILSQNALLAQWLTLVPSEIAKNAQETFLYILALTGQNFLLVAKANIPCNKVSSKNPSLAVVEAKKSSVNPEVQQESTRCITQPIPLLWGQSQSWELQKIWLGLFVLSSTKCEEN